MRTLENLLLDELAEMYDAEQEMARALSRMARLASSEQLREALKAHACETVGHISKVAHIFECFGELPVMVKCPTIGSLLAEGAALVEQQEDPAARDAAIIAAMQKLEHYEMATYVCLRDWARVLESHEAATLLDEILDEEKSSHHKLNELDQALNPDALRALEPANAMDRDDEGATKHHAYTYRAGFP